MANLLQTIFGGSTSQSTATSKPVDVTPSQFTDLRSPFAATLGNLLATSGGPSYTGPLYSPITTPEQNILGQLQGQTGPGTSRNQLLESTLQGNYLPGQPGANPFLDAAIKAAQRPTLEGLTQTLTRDLPGRFTAGGQFIQPKGSSAFDTAAALATRGAANALSDIATNISYGAYNAERQRQQEAVPLSQAEVQTSINNLQAQALPRLIQELGIERGLSLFKDKTSQLLQALQILSGVTAPHLGQESTQTSTSETDKGILPGITSAFSALFPKGL